MSAVPGTTDSASSPEYDARLKLMENWYEHFVADDRAQQHLLQDYAPHVPFLGSLRGRVLDVGGGAGLAARFMRPAVTYVVVDPLQLWQSPQWAALGRTFRAGGPEPEFVNACGEDLPFADEAFDFVICFWSLNHVRSPQQCVAEIIRVLRRGGRARLVLEDMEPAWPDLLKNAIGRIRSRFTSGRSAADVPHPLVSALRMKLGGKWQVEDDHFPIDEQQLIRWMRGKVTVCCREWLTGYLTFDVEKQPSGKSG